MNKQIIKATPHYLLLIPFCILLKLEPCSPNLPKVLFEMLPPDFARVLSKPSSYPEGFMDNSCKWSVPDSLIKSHFPFPLKPSRAHGITGRALIYQASNLENLVTPFCMTRGEGC